MILESRKKFFIQSPEGDIIEVKGIRLSDSTHIISLVRANKLLNQGCEIYLTYVINSSSDESQMSKIWTICEFSDVEFVIEVYPGITLVFIASYRMTPMELKGLKIQLQDLLN
ncbi:RVP_2 domain-containing protein [Gossypium australe]|uniref:RVP_2 domain-containing protein n=1 Tax=Gossypium australe TaxID=47621 RepID=A0A5B6VDE2_9ROSI|nr:RVP_2 domain-containing protein [Gossypium australe]